MAYNSAYTGEQIDAAVGAVRQKESTWDNKQAALTGTQGQFVGFGAEGNPTPKGVMAGDVKFSDGQTFQQKYDSGELTGPTGPAGAPGDPGQPGAPGAAGTPATINGVNALTIQAGGNVQMSQEGGVVTISAKPKVFPATLLASGWNATTKSQTVTVNGVPADENAFEAVYIYPSSLDAVVTAAGLRISATAQNSVTFTCLYDVPTADLTVGVKLIEIDYVS